MTATNQDANKRVYLFAEGANLCEMSRIGLPVPPGFVISTNTCLDFFSAGMRLPAGVENQYVAALHKVEKSMGKEFGNPACPLLVSVRSGAAVSMPGMMDTVLNLGMNDQIAEALAAKMFSNVVMGESCDKFEEVLHNLKKNRGYKNDCEVTAEDWKDVVRQFKAIAPNVPMDPHEQLRKAIQAVFSSWFTPRAVRYRQYNGIPDDLGTAVNVQCMVFGNKGVGSGTGVAFTRNPATGERVFYGEYLENAEGEDVVSGIRTPESLAFLQTNYPKLYEQLDNIQKGLENHYRDMQDLEFTIEDEKLYILQTRNGKRTAKASVKIAVDMVSEGLITEKEALLRLDAERMHFFLHPAVDPNAPKTVLAKGLPASPGAATGTLVFTPEEAEELANKGQKVVLVRKETTADDIHGMRAAVGILTEHGGMTSHAAVVARGMGKCCVSGCHQVSVDCVREMVTTHEGKVLRKGDVITLNGSTGEVLLGDVARIPAGADKDFQTILTWADKYRKLRVCTNGDTPQDATKAIELGAQGIGLCRTEHMFFSPDRIDVVREMILSETLEERQKALDRLFFFQKEDMLALFKTMSGKPVTIRLLDPPLHEFLPKALHIDEVNALAQRINKNADLVKQEIMALEECNPMLGFRGCRLSVKYPEISRMQVKAIITAAIEAKKQGAEVVPEIMIPLVSTVKELESIIPKLREDIKEVFEAQRTTVKYEMGTMMEVPRACLTAASIAPLVEFMSFGTNDLTQMTFGFSRDDINEFLPIYLENKILTSDPFVEIDREGVGQLIKMTIQNARAANPHLKFGVCGEQGGEPKSVQFFHDVGLDYVSCSPFRVPIARVAAAQAALSNGGK